MLSDDLIEKYAIKCARGSNGGGWKTHYTERQKNYWRAFVRNLSLELLVLLAKNSD
jgi:hypothetical protein